MVIDKGEAPNNKMLLLSVHKCLRRSVEEFMLERVVNALF